MTRRVIYPALFCCAVSLLLATPAAAQLEFQILLSVDPSPNSEGPSPGNGLPGGRVLVLDSSGNPINSIGAGQLNFPRGTALAPDGTFFVSVTGGLGSGDGFILKVEPDGTFETDAMGDPVPFLTGVTPFDLEIDPVGGDLFISDATPGSASVLRVPLSGPGAGVPEVVANTFNLPDGSPGGDLVPSGLGFAPNGDLFVGLQTTTPDVEGTAGLIQVDPTTGDATQVGILDLVFDVQVDSQGNVFGNNVVPGGSLGGGGGEIAFFPGLGAATSLPTSLIESETFSPTAIRGLAIGPDDDIFASTAGFTLVKFDPFDAATFDPTDPGEVFVDFQDPVFDLLDSNSTFDPFAFDIFFVVPEPTAAVSLLTALAGCAIRRRR